MKVASTNQVVVLTIPQPDLLLLLVVPEFKALLARFPSLIKAQFAAEPCKLFIRRTVVPFILEIKNQTPEVPSEACAADQIRWDQSL